jgi:hypothetical protein
MARHLVIELDQKFRFYGTARIVTDEQITLYRKIWCNWDKFHHFVDVTRLNEYPIELFKGVKLKEFQPKKEKKK